MYEKSYVLLSYDNVFIFQWLHIENGCGVQEIILESAKIIITLIKEFKFNHSSNCPEGANKCQIDIEPGASGWCSLFSLPVVSFKETIFPSLCGIFI